MNRIEELEFICLRNIRGKLILFGSTGTQWATKESDIDLQLTLDDAY